jgi:hypothetical protein
MTLISGESAQPTIKEHPAVITREYIWEEILWRPWNNTPNAHVCTSQDNQTKREGNKSWSQKPLMVWREGMTWEWTSGPKLWVQQTEPVPALCNQRKGKTLGCGHCDANEIQKNSQTLGAPLNSGLRESSKMSLPHVQDIKIRLKLVWGVTLTFPYGGSKAALCI